MRTKAPPLRDPKTVLQEWAQARGMPTPVYREIARSGPHHDPEFRVAVQLPQLAPAEGSGRSKRAAEQAAAAALMAREEDSSPSAWMPEASEGEAGSSVRRCGFVAVIGAPNVGKSTLVNALVGSKVSIVTPKVQTTRALIRGIAIEGQSQLILVDTPEIFPRRRLDRAMVEGAWAGTRDADLVALVIDPSRDVEEDDEAVVKALAGMPVTKVLVLNKIDLVAKPKLLDLAQALNDRAAFAATFMISARSADGVAELKSFLAAHVAAGPWLYPADQISDAPMRQFAAE